MNTNTATEACIASIDAAIDEIVQYHNDNTQSIHLKDIAEFRSNLLAVICGDIPQEYAFDFIGAGAYKEAYKAFGGWIVKFACRDNPTAIEQQILVAAKHWGIDIIFPKTIYIKMPRAIPSINIAASETCRAAFSYQQGCNGECDRCKENAEQSGYQLDTIILQPRASISGDISTDMEKIFNDDWYAANEIKYQDGTALDYKSYTKSPITSHSWMKRLYASYPKEIILKFEIFLRHFMIEDLHMMNLGYVDGLPVILDWISYNDKEEEDVKF